MCAWPDKTRQRLTRRAAPAIHGKEKDEKADASAPQEQGLVKGASDELMNKPRWQRAIISFAGPLVNLVFPILLLTVYFVAIGIPYPAYQDKPVQVTGLPPNSPAAQGKV